MKGGFKPKHMRYRWKPQVAKVLCGECGTQCSPTKGERLYPPGHDLVGRNFYVCRNCDARVACHMDTWAPMGKPANADTRYWRNQAHKVLDPLWLEQTARWGRDRRHARAEVYRWAAGRLGVPALDFHIGNLMAAECKTLIALAREEFEAYSKKPLDTPEFGR